MSDTAPRRRLARRRDLGIAIGAGRITAVGLRWSARGLRPVPLWERPLGSPPAEGGWSELSSALTELRESLGGAAVSAHIALLPPLAHAKVVELPPVRRSQLGTLLQRNVRRYFVAGPEALTADAWPLHKRSGAVAAPALAICAAERVVRSVVAAAGAAGVRVRAVTAGSVALLEALRVLAPVGRGRVAAVACAEEWSEILYLDGGIPVLLQPLASGDPRGRPADRVWETLSHGMGQAFRPEGLVVCGAGADAELLRERAAQEAEGGLALLPAPALHAASPPELAAFGAVLAGERPPQLLTDSIRIARKTRHRRQTAAFSAAAALVVGAAAGVHLWGVQQEIEAVEASRRSAAPAVAEAMEARRALESLRGWLETVGHVEAEARWTETFAALARALPDSAYLVSFSANEEQIRLGGVAQGAHGVVPALQASPLFAGAAFTSPLRRDEADGRERFEIVVPVRRAAVTEGDTERPREGSP